MIYRADALYFLKYSVEHGENFNIAVIIDSSYAIGFKVVRVYHVDVVEVSRRRFIGEGSRGV